MQCAYCGASIELPWDAAPVVVVKAPNGTNTVRLVRVQGRRFHRCAEAEAARPVLSTAS
jgi:hypothetical protein